MAQNFLGNKYPIRRAILDVQKKIRERNLKALGNHRCDRAAGITSRIREFKLVLTNHLRRELFRTGGVGVLTVLIENLEVDNPPESMVSFAKG